MRRQEESNQAGDRGQERQSDDMVDSVHKGLKPSSSLPSRATGLRVSRTRGQNRNPISRTKCGRRTGPTRRTTNRKIRRINMSQRTLTEEDEGKRVVNVSGDRIGVISGVRNGSAFVDPNPGITDTIKSKLGWENVDEDDYPLKHSKIDRVTDDEVRLKRDL